MPSGFEYPNSLRTKLRTFFRNNPDEELTYKELTAKLGCKEATARDVVKALKAEGTCEAIFIIRAHPDLIREAK